MKNLKQGISFSSIEMVCIKKCNWTKKFVEKLHKLWVAGNISKTVFLLKIIALISK